MSRFVGKLTTSEAGAIADIDGDYQFIPGPPKVYKGQFVVPDAALSSVEAGSLYLLDIQGGPRLMIRVNRCRHSNGAASVAEFASQGPPLVRQ